MLRSARLGLAGAPDAQVHRALEAHHVDGCAPAEQRANTHRRTGLHAAHVEPPHVHTHLQGLHLLIYSSLDTKFSVLQYYCTGI